MIDFIPLNLEINESIFIDLNMEYITWINEVLKSQYDFDVEASGEFSITEYVKQSVADFVFTPPQGIFYLVKFDGEIVGMGGLKTLAKGIAEVKRMFVRPQYRGKGLGMAILEKILVKAREFGFSTVRLDSAPFMHSAHKLYRAAGFYEVEGYPESEGKWMEEQGIGVVFMEKKL
jgi:GNAT superfamily N-acetyltransferase